MKYHKKFSATKLVQKEKCIYLESYYFYRNDKELKSTLRKAQGWCHLQWFLRNVDFNSQRAHVMFLGEWRFNFVIYWGGKNLVKDTLFISFSS